MHHPLADGDGLRAFALALPALDAGAGALIRTETCITMPCFIQFIKHHAAVQSIEQAWNIEFNRTRQAVFTLRTGDGAQFLILHAYLVDNRQFFRCE